MLHMDLGAERWFRALAYKNLWKVEQACYDIEDLIQDGYYCWYLVANKYETVATEYEHMMRLFQTTSYNHIRWMATIGKDASYQKVCTQISDLVAHNGEESELFILDRVLYKQRLASGFDESDEFRIGQLISEAFEPVRSILKLLTSERSQKVFRTPFRRRLDGTRETINDRIRALLELPRAVAPLELTKWYLTYSLKEI